MKILAIEFSSEQRSVALVEKTGSENCRVLGAVSDSTRQAAALSLVENVLGESKTEREQIEVVAVGIGPGSYNGIRAAIALAQGWQLASAGKVKLLGISSAECLARVAQRQIQNSKFKIENSNKTRVIIDAQRNEVYSAVYEISAEEIREIKSLCIAPIGELAGGLQPGEIIVGSEVKRWFEEGVRLFPEAAMLGEIAASRSNFVSSEKLEPIYLRESSFVKAPAPRVIV